MHCLAQVMIIHPQSAHCSKTMRASRTAYIDLSKTMHLRLQSVQDTTVRYKSEAACMADRTSSLLRQGSKPFKP